MRYFSTALALDKDIKVRTGSTWQQREKYIHSVMVT